MREQLARLARFGMRVVRHFLDNRGLLLAGGVAYNALLSLVPLAAVLLIGLSHFFDADRLLLTIQAELHLIVPAQAGSISDALKALLAERSVIGGIGIVVLLFFSSIAFRMLEEAIASIFHTPDHVEGRSFWVSAIIPYVYIVLLGVGLVLITALTSGLEAISGRTLSAFGYELSLSEAPAAGLYFFGFIGLVLLLASIYKVLPIIKIRFRRAIIGGLTAALLWEAVRHFLVWYFGSISLVNVIYGSLATVIIVLLSMEVAAVIILIGAQVIAELERSAAAGLPWWQDARDVDAPVAQPDLPEPALADEPSDADDAPDDALPRHA